ncbi:MAG TPA: hypothetical protein VNN10_15830 [Dehalococcoidia bacterium]|nr:hypothetical protein [Dehalococcoidia bacterium]
MLESELYAQMKLALLEDPRLLERGRVLAHFHAEAGERPGRLARFLGMRMVALGTWLEKAGASMAFEPQSQERTA